MKLVLKCKKKPYTYLPQNIREYLPLKRDLRQLDHVPFGKRASLT